MVLQHPWEDIATAPYNRELELAVIEKGEVHSIVFPCRRVVDGWCDATTMTRLPVDPTHWRPWGKIS